MLTLDQLGSPLKFEVDQNLKQKARKYNADIIKPITVTPEQPSTIDYGMMDKEKQK